MALNTVKPELEDPAEKLRKNFPGLYFFNAKGGLNEYGKIAEELLDCRAKLRESQ